MKNNQNSVVNDNSLMEVNRKVNVSESKAIDPLSIAIIDGFNPRTDYGDEATFNALKESIRNEGLIEPLTIWNNPQKGEGKAQYALVDGHRRLTAILEIIDDIRKEWITENNLPEDTPMSYEVRSELAKELNIPVLKVVKANFKQIGSMQDALFMALNTGLHKKGFNPIEEGATYYRLKNEFGFSEAEIAKKLCVNYARISDSIAAYEYLSDSIKRLVATGVISFNTAKELFEYSHVDQDNIAPQLIQRSQERIDMNASKKVTNNDVHAILDGMGITPVGTSVKVDENGNPIVKKSKKASDESGNGETVNKRGPKPKDTALSYNSQTMTKEATFSELNKLFHEIMLSQPNVVISPTLERILSAFQQQALEECTFPDFLAEMQAINEELLDKNM